jgi:hypothetical protein
MYRFILILPFLLPLHVSAETLHAGFVQGLWYADTEIFADRPTRVYVAFRNNTDDDLTGTVEFFVNDTSIGSSNIRVLKGRVVEAWTDWTPAYGNQEVRATITNVVLHKIGGATTSVQIADVLATDARVVDRDTDNDQIGDERDTDDDNDGVSDADERLRGTDPTKPDQAATLEEETVEPVAQTASAREGLEQYLGEGMAQAALQTFTETIHESKQAVDAYRKERARTRVDDLIPNATTSDDIIITRTSIEHEMSIWQKIKEGGAALLSHIWTFILYVVSNILAHPVFVQVGLLLGILYALYRIVRGAAKRPGF